jgi:hypothetical protein
MAKREDLIQEVDKSQLPEDITPEVGMGLLHPKRLFAIVEVKEALSSLTVIILWKRVDFLILK